MSAAPPPPEPSRLDELSCLESMRRGDPTCLGGFFEAWGDRLYLVLDTTRCTILLYRAARSPSLDALRREALLRRLEKACRGGGDPV